MIWVCSAKKKSVTAGIVWEERWGAKAAKKASA